jgi:hypothetical protein
VRHFVQYHNPEVMGRPYKPSHKNFGIVTDKFFRSLVGATVWLVTGKGRPRHYYLCSTFTVDKVERENAGRFRNRVSGSVGKDLDPFVEIGEKPWFPELLKATGNFGLGLQRITDEAIIRGLQDVASS